MKHFLTSLIFAGLVLVPVTASAGLLSKLGRLGDDVGSAGRKVDGIEGTNVPKSALRAAKGPGGTAVVLSVDDVGNRRLTDELGRATEIRVDGDLDAALRSLGGKDLTVVADAVTIGKGLDLAQELAARGHLKLWHKNKAFAVRESEGTLMAQTRPGVFAPFISSEGAVVMAGGKRAGYVRTRLLDEVLFAFDKPLTRGRVVVAKIGTPPKGPRKIGFGDAATRPGETLTVTKDDLVQGLAGHRGGTVVMTGRIEGDLIRTDQGPVPLADIQRAAAAADVHLVVMNGSAKAAHKVVADADTFGDLILGLADRRTAMVARAAADNKTRVRLTFAPEVQSTASTTSRETIEDIAIGTGHLAGHAGANIVELFTTDKTETEDREMRVIPWLSFGQHLLFGGSILFGLLGHRPAWWFWRKIWVLPTSSRPWRIARGAGYAVFMLFTGIFWGMIRYLFGWVAWFVPSWRKPKAA